MYCPIILGSDQTTVTVGTGQMEYHPVYLSIGNPHNIVRRAHRNAVIPIAFLAIPKGSLLAWTRPIIILTCPGDRRSDDSSLFRKFKRRLFHTSIATILRSLKSGMITPVVRRCPDGHFRRVIYDLIAFIADYPEQVALTGIVQGWCPKYVFHTPTCSQSHHMIRCVASSKDLDGCAAPGRRTTALTDGLISTLDSKTLWDEYGIDDDIIVTISS